jgi:Porin PorA
MRRRVTGLILAGLGAFLLVAALLARTYIPGQVVKYPLNEYLVTQLVGHDVSYFSATKVKPITGATMVVTSTVKSDGKAGTSSTAVWDSFTYLYDQTNHLKFSYSIRRFAFDRQTAQLVMCCGANVDGNAGVRQSGLVGFLWPMGAQKHTYQVFDPAINQTRPASYVGTATVGGVSTYKFVEKVAPTRSGQETVPRSLVGMKGSSTVTLPEMTTETNTFYVDPVTGAQLNETQAEHVALVDSSGAERLLLLNASLTNTPRSLAKVVRIDKKARNEINLLKVVVPLAAGVVGIVLLVGGILLARPRRDDQPDYSGSESTEPALDPAL